MAESQGGEAGSEEEGSRGGGLGEGRSGAYSLIEVD